MFEEILLCISSAIFVFMTVEYFRLKQEVVYLKLDIEIEREDNRAFVKRFKEEMRKNEELERCIKREMGRIE